MQGETGNIYSGALINVSSGSQLTENGKKALEGKQWVLRFAETKNSTAISTGSSASTSYSVGNVSILRLKFRTDGKVYNLGVIDNKQTGSNEPVNKETTIITLTDLGKLILFILAIVLLIILVVVFIKPIGYVLAFVFKTIYFIVSLPFKLIKKVRDNIKAKDIQNSNDIPNVHISDTPSFAKQDKPRKRRK